MSRSARNRSSATRGSMSAWSSLPAKGSSNFVRSLKGTPKRVGALRKEYDDHDLIDRMLSSLLGLGFAHPISRHGPVVMRTALRRAVVIDLDVGAALEDVCAQWNAGKTAPEVLVLCSRLSDHATTLRELADRRAAGILRAHHVVVRALDIRCGAEIIELLARLRASIEFDSVEWPAPANSPPGLADLVQARIDTHVVMAPDASILEGTHSPMLCRVGSTRVCLRPTPAPRSVGFRGEGLRQRARRGASARDRARRRRGNECTRG